MPDQTDTHLTTTNQIVTIRMSTPQIVAWLAAGLTMSGLIALIGHFNPPDGSAPLWAGIFVWSVASWVSSLAATMLAMRYLRGAVATIRKGELDRAFEA